MKHGYRHFIGHLNPFVLHRNHLVYNSPMTTCFGFIDHDNRLQKKKGLEHHKDKWCFDRVLKQDFWGLGRSNLDGWRNHCIPPSQSYRDLSYLHKIGCKAQPELFCWVASHRNRNITYLALGSQHWTFERSLDTQSPWNNCCLPIINSVSIQHTFYLIPVCPTSKEWVALKVRGEDVEKV